MAKRKSIRAYPALSAISAKWVLSNLPFVFFLGLLTTVYIANRHYSEKNIREIQALQEEVDQLRWHYLSLKSDLMKESKQSEVAKEVSSLGLSNKGEHPVKIRVEQ